MRKTRKLHLIIGLAYAAPLGCPPVVYQTEQTSREEAAVEEAPVATTRAVAIPLVRPCEKAGRRRHVPLDVLAPSLKPLQSLVEDETLATDEVRQ